MRLLVKVEGYGTAEVVMDGVALTLEMAIAAAEQVEYEKFPGADMFTVYDMDALYNGRVVNVRPDVSEESGFTAALVR